MGDLDGTSEPEHRRGLNQPGYEGAIGAAVEAGDGVPFGPWTEAELSRLLQSERDARASAERSAHRLAHLQDVTAGLSEARTPEEVAEVIVGRVVAAAGATSGALCLLTEDGRDLEVVRSYGFDAATIEGFSTIPLEADLPAADALRTRRIVLIRSLDERDRFYPGLANAVARNRAFAVIPIVSGQEALGAVAIGWLEPRDFDDDDVRFLDAIGLQAGQALDRARFLASEHESARRLGFLADASRVLSSSLDYEETLERVARLAVPRIADLCTVHLVDDAGLRLAVTAQADPGRDGDLKHRLAEGGKPASAIFERIVDTGEPVLVLEPPRPGGHADDDVDRDRDQDRDEVLSQLGARSAIAVPLSTNDRRTGVLALVMAGSDRRYRKADLPFIEDLAGRVAVAIENARAQRARSEVVRTLQQSLLPESLPLLPGLEVAGRYHPIGGRSEVGGDFYDVFPIGYGRWGVVIGDVSGKGVMAAQLTALARYTIRTAARGEERPSQVLAVVNRSLIDHEPGDRFCTIVHGFIDTAEDPVRLTISCGGHPLPLLLDGDGTVRSIGATGTAVGLMTTPLLTDETHRLLPGETVVLYTDGVIEARAADGSFADGLLESVLEGCRDRPADEVAAAIESAMLEFQGGEPRDDMAVVVVRAPARMLRERVALSAEGFSDGRRRLREWLGEHVGGPLERFDDVLIVAGELATNAARAARNVVELRAWTASNRVVVEVADDGPGFDGLLPSPDAMPDPTAERGRGLFLVRSVATECKVQSGPHGTTVRCAVEI